MTLKDGVCTAVRLAACGVASKPTRLVDAESVLLGQPPEGDVLAATAEAARQYSTSGDDRQASADYRKDLVAALVRRSVTKAADRARSARDGEVDGAQEAARAVSDPRVAVSMTVNGVRIEREVSPACC